MNYFIDFIPNTTFIKKIEELFSKLNKEDNIILNMYIKQLPAMNINETMYCDFEESIKNILEFKKRNLKINIMLDRYCFGNKEFTETGKEIFDILDKIFEYDVEYITVTNHFIFNYIKRRYKNVKKIISEYSEINNVQKVYRYIENIKADGVKLDFKLSLNYENMKYIKENFDINYIHIDINKLYYNNDILKDSLNNSLSHYIQENNWDKARQCSMKNDKIYFKKENYNYLKELGYKNFWCYFDSNENTNEYIKKIKKFIL